jgi:hypothetical protein
MFSLKSYISDDKQMARQDVTLTARLPRIASPLTCEDQATLQLKWNLCPDASFIARKNSVRNCCLSLLNPSRTMKIPVDRYSGRK